MNNMKPEGICDVQMSRMVLEMAKRAPRRVCGYVIGFVELCHNLKATGLSPNAKSLIDELSEVCYAKFTG